MTKKIGLLLILVLLAGTAYAEHQMTKWDLITKARLGTGLKPDDSTATIAVRQGMDFIQSAAIYPVALDTQRIDLSATTELYALPATCYEPITVFLSPRGRALDWTTAGNKQRLQEKSSISEERLEKVFYEQDNNLKFIGFDPVPSAADSVQLIFEPSCNEVSFGADSNTQKINIREVYHPALVAAVKSYLYERYDRHDKANRYLEKATWLINIAERKLGTPPIDVWLQPKGETRP